MAENIQIGLFSGGYNKNFRLFGNKKVIKAGQILDTNPVTVKPDEDLYTAYYRLHENSSEWAFAVDEDKKVLGILTRKDILK